MEPAPAAAAPALGQTLAIPSPVQPEVPGPGAPSATAAPPLGQTVVLPASAEPAHAPAQTPFAPGQTLAIAPPHAVPEPATAAPPAGAPGAPSNPLARTVALPPGAANAPSGPGPEPPRAPNAPGPPMRSTVLGLGAPALGANESGQHAPVAQGLSGTVLMPPPAAGVHQVVKPQARTMVGLAPEPPPAPPAAPQGSDARANPPPHVKTMMGVALPGIAPINPGVPKPEPEPAPLPTPPPSPAETAAAAPAPPKAGPGAKTMTLKAARKNERVGAIAIGAALVSLLAGAGLYFYLAGPEDIEARVVLDPEGRERILLQCPRCEDGTAVRLDSSQTTFQNQKAELAVPRPLDVGDTPFTLAVRAPGGGREMPVALNVRVDYRVRADLTGLADASPRVRVVVHAVPGSQATVDGRPVTLDAKGHGGVDFDVSQELTGQDSGIRRLERRIPYSVTPPEGTSQQGQVVIQLGITPLVVDAPGEKVMIEGPTFVLAGRTVKGGTVSVEGRPLQVDGDGRFAQVMNVSSVGETTIRVRASADDHAPRLFPIRVRRVASFAEEASRFRTQATASYAAIASSIEDKRGWKIALDGSVVERGNDPHSTLFLFDVTSGCSAAPCLARVEYGAPTELRAGDRVSVFGQVAGAVDGPRRGTKIPEIEADFIVKGKR